MVAGKAITKSLRYFSQIAPQQHDRAQVRAMYAVPEIFVREALWRIAHPNNNLIGQDPQDLENVLQFLAFAAPLVPHSSAQFFQDLWALWETNSKRGGYFVEFGATDGKVCSNTYFLEKGMGWTGIVAEPNPTFSEELLKNRSCYVSHKLVYTTSGERVDFDLTEIPSYARIGSGPRSITLETVSLNDLLHEARAPIDIDFLSVDTEGSEFDILSAFDFERWNVRCITVEHNQTPNREKLFGLLTSRGFRRKWPMIGHVDDWYVRDQG